MADNRNTFLTAQLNLVPFTAESTIADFELLSDAEQNAVEKNLMHIYSRTFRETALWNHIEKNGLRVDRD